MTKYVSIFIFYFFAIEACGQENPSLYFEPNAIKLLNPEKVKISIERTLDETELISFYKKKNSLKCYLDSLGRVIKIDAINTDFNLSPINLQLLKLNFIKCLKFDIPSEYRSSSMQDFRYFVLITNPKILRSKSK